MEIQQLYMNFRTAGQYHWESKVQAPTYFSIKIGDLYPRLTNTVNVIRQATHQP